MKEIYTGWAYLLTVIGVESRYDLPYNLNLFERYSFDHVVVSGVSMNQWMFKRSWQGPVRLVSYCDHSPK